jgi:CD36 family
VKIGARHGNADFFKIDTWNYRQSVPNYKPELGDCNASVVGSSEGAIYPQNNTKDSVLWFWRSTLCRAVPLHFDTEVQMGNLKGYKYILRDDVYDRLENRTADCYKGSNLPDGLSDVSKCFFGEFELSPLRRHPSPSTPFLTLFSQINRLLPRFPTFIRAPGNFLRDSRASSLKLTSTEAIQLSSPCWAFH